MSLASSTSLAATTVAVGWRSAISRDRLGPDRTAMRSGGRQAASAIISSTLLSDPSSRPFARDRTATSSVKEARAASRVGRTALTGTATTIRRRPVTAWAMSEVASMRSERVIPGRYVGFSWPLMKAIVSGLRPHTVTDTPASARTWANVVPHAPVPSTAAVDILIETSLSRPFYSDGSGGHTTRREGLFQRSVRRSLVPQTPDRCPRIPLRPVLDARD